VLILREALEFSAAETALALDTSVTSVNSMLQRARTSVRGAAQGVSQQDELRSCGEQGRRDLVTAFVAAWENADVQSIVGLLAEDARFSMPPLPAWFVGREMIIRFMLERAFDSDWRLSVMNANAQLAFAHFRAENERGPFLPAAINIVTLRDGLIVDMAAFLDPRVHQRFGLPEALPR
jgi:RNA polymerase sigma-70 factor (ECF subfamily)